MTSVQAELSSARLRDESHTTQDTEMSDLCASASFEEISARIGGRFTADLAAILRNASEPLGEKKPEPSRNRPERDTYANRQFALQCLRTGKIQQAVSFIQHHAPEQIEWLNRQIKGSRGHVRVDSNAPKSINEYMLLSRIAVVPEIVKIDTEVGRIARVLGQFALFRAWAYGLAAGKGDGWINRNELESLWRNLGIARTPRHARRLISDGVSEGYWTQDRINKRIYLSGQVKVAAQLVRKALVTGDPDIVGTNLPGRRPVTVNLAGTLQEASARLYAAWLASKDPQHNGTIISRETLCQLWRVSTPTLLTWEGVAGIDSQANYAQQNDTTIDRVPAYAYLTLNQDGSYAAAWRLPNNYTVVDQTIQQHSHTGKAKKIRRAVHVEIVQAEQRGSIGDAASLRSGKRYFVRDTHSHASPFRACESYLRKLGRRDGDLSQRRYFYIGQRHGVRVFEAYNLRSGACETNIHQRLIWQEGNDKFVAVKASYRRAVKDCC